MALFKHLSNIFTVFIFVLFSPLVAPQAYAQPLACKDLFGSNGNKTDFIFDLLLGDLNGARHLFENKDPKLKDLQFGRIWESKRFQSFATRSTRKSLESLSFDERSSLIKAYIDASLNMFRNQSFLKEQQNKDRTDRLNKLGLDLDGKTDSWDALSKLSQKNLQSNLQKLSQVQIDKSESIEHLIDSLQLFYVHNSRKMTEVPNYPLTSPKTLERILNKQYGLSSAPFNKLLGSDHHVYFHAKFRRPDQSPIVRSRQYGASGVVLNPSYAKNNAMINPFVMYDFELLDAASKFNKDITEKIWKKVPKKVQLPYFESQELVNETGPDLLRAFQELKAAVFTPTDLEALVKATLRVHFAELRESDPRQFDAEIKNLQEGNLTAIEVLITNAVFGRLGFKPNFII